MASAIDFAPGYEQGRTIANVAAQIGARFGATPGTAALAPLASTGLVEAIARASHVVVLLLDGVGCAQLEGLSPAGALARARICELDSTFPSSTAPAVTTFATGEAPGSQAVTGWHMWSQRHQSVVRPLPLDYWGQPGHIDARDLFGWIPLSARM
ncbi:MAG: alkaline phosphatase family protein, partial [Betaproteobacteria bacterium]